MSESANLRELRALLTRILEVVERGELDATSSKGRALLRHLQGARAALDELVAQGARPRRAARPAKSRRQPADQKRKARRS